MSYFISVAFVLLWSTGFIGAKFGLPYAEPFTFLSIRFAFVVLLLIPVWLVARPRIPTRNEILHLSFAGVLLQAGYLGGVFESIHLGIPTGVSALIVGLQPVLTPFLSRHLLNERLSARQWIGLSLGVLGVMLVVHEKITLDGLSAKAIAMSVLGLLSIAIGAVWQKRYCSHVDLRSSAIVQFSAALLVTAPIAYCFESRGVEWTSEFVLALGWLVVGLSLGAIFLLLWLIRHRAATSVASLVFLVPPSTAVFAWLLFGETYRVASAIGMILAVFAVWMVTTRHT